MGGNLKAISGGMGTDDPNTNTLMWELIGTVTWVNTNTLMWELIGTVMWVYTNKPTWELNRYRRTGPDQTRHPLNLSIEYIRRD